MDCHTCGNETWYDAKNSSTFSETDEPYYLSNGLFVGYCRNAKDTLSATSNMSLALTDFPFCHLKGMKNNFWDYSAALSFARNIGVWDDFIEN